MFDISFWEITVICVITLLVVGPEKLPGLVRDVGRVVRKLRRIVTQTRYELEREFSFEEERKKLAKDLAQDSEGLNEAMDELDDLMKIAPDRDDKAAQTDDNIKPTEAQNQGDMAAQTDDNIKPTEAQNQGEKAEQTDDNINSSADQDDTNDNIKSAPGRDQDDKAEDTVNKRQTAEP
jgi:sec-independent protein translocase protein TatB